MNKKDVVIILNDGVGGMVERMHQLGMRLDSVSEIFVLNSKQGGFFTSIVNLEKYTKTKVHGDLFFSVDVEGYRLYVGDVASESLLVSKLQSILCKHGQTKRFLSAGNSTTFYALLVRWIFRYRVSIFFLSRNSLMEKGWCSRLVYRTVYWLLLKPSDAVVSISKGLQQELKTRSSRVHRRVIYNGISLPINNVHEYRSERLEGGNFLVVARLDRQKRIDLCIDAISILRKNGHDIDLTIYGDGEERVRLERRSLKYNLEKQVHFKGWVKKEDIPYEDHSAFILSSDFEGFGISIIEAMSHGLAPIVTDCPHGPAEIVENTVSGYVVSKGSVTAIADALEKWVLSSLDAKRAMSEAAVERASFFCQRKMINSYRKLLDDNGN